MPSTEHLKATWVDGNLICFPFASEHFAIAGFQSRCGSCGEWLPEIRGSIDDDNGPIELRAVGLCGRCNQLTNVRVRFYPGGRAIALQAGQWIDISKTKNWWWGGWSASVVCFYRLGGRCKYLWRSLFG